MNHLLLILPTLLVLACSPVEDQLFDEDSESETETTAGTETSETSETGEPVSFCGDGVVQGEEECDGKIENLTCGDLWEGWSGGVFPSCREDCTLDTTACESCGDSKIQEGEVCDSSNFGGADCQALGYVGGSLLCSLDCLQVIEGSCEVSPYCGDGILQPEEACDGENLGDNTCESLGFSGGVLGCKPDTCAWDFSGCVPE